MNIQKEPLERSLFALRITVFLVMFMWTIDKFINPQHAVAVYEHFYFLGGLSHSIMYILGGLELIILFAFLIGICKKFSYGAVLLFHSVSTFSSYKQYLSPFQDYHLLFFAAWPMLAACLTLFLLREYDTLFSKS